MLTAYLSSNYRFLDVNIFQIGTDNAVLNPMALKRSGEASRRLRTCYGKCSRSSISLCLPAACLFFLRSWSEIKFIRMPSISMTSRLE